MSKPDIPPNITSLEMLHGLYQELSAPFLPYFVSILRIAWRDNSPDTEEVIVHTGELPESALERSNYRGSKTVVEDRSFEEETCGSLYSPVSALGYRSFDYSWALAFKIDCDLARKKTGDILDGAAHYISDIAADDKILKRRASIGNAPGQGRPSKTNTEDLEERYLKKMKNLSASERNEISKFLKKNKKALDSSNQSFRHEDYRSKTDAYSISISAGPDDLDDENFLSWLIEKTDGSHTIKRKLDLDELDQFNND